MGYRFSNPARQDIIDIFLRGAEIFGDAQADRYLAGLHDGFAFLADSPKAARERTEFKRPVRVHPYKAHLVIYRIDGDDILILRLRHGHEDWQASTSGDA